MQIGDLGRYLRACRKIKNRMGYHFDVCKRSAVVGGAGKRVPCLQNIGCDVPTLIQILAPSAVVRWSELLSDV